MEKSQKVKQEELQLHKDCDTALAFGILIPAGIAVAVVSAPVSVPLAGTIGATAGFTSAFAVSHHFSYKDLYDVHYNDKESVSDEKMTRERHKEKYNIVKNEQYKIPSPSFRIIKFIENLFDSKENSNSK